MRIEIKKKPDNSVLLRDLSLGDVFFSAEDEGKGLYYMKVSHQNKANDIGCLTLDGDPRRRAIVEKARLTKVVRVEAVLTIGNK